MDEQEEIITAVEGKTNGFDLPAEPDEMEGE